MRALLKSNVSLDYQRRVDAVLVQPPRPELLEGRYVAAICRACGGWTMFSANPLGETGVQQSREAFLDGDLIVYWKNPTSLGHACTRFDDPPLKNCDGVAG